LDTGQERETMKTTVINTLTDDLKGKGCQFELLMNPMKPIYNNGVIIYPDGVHSPVFDVTRDETFIIEYNRAMRYVKMIQTLFNHGLTPKGFPFSWEFGGQNLGNTHTAYYQLVETAHFLGDLDNV
jgi:hypothetical protein